MKKLNGVNEKLINNEMIKTIKKYKNPYNIRTEINKH